MFKVNNKNTTYGHYETTPQVHLICVVCSWKRFYFCNHLIFLQVLLKKFYFRRALNSVKPEKEIFAKIVNGFQLFTIFAKNFFLEFDWFCRPGVFIVNFEHI